MCPGVPLPVAAPLCLPVARLPVIVTYLVSALTRNDQTTAESPRGGETGRHTAYLPTKVFSHVLNRRAIDALNHTHTHSSLCIVCVCAKHVVPWCSFEYLVIDLRPSNGTPFRGWGMVGPPMSFFWDVGSFLPPLVRGVSKYLGFYHRKVNRSLS